MKLKDEITVILVSIGLSIIIISGIFYYYNAKSSLLKQVKNQLESLSETKKLRLEGIIKNHLSELHSLQNRSSLKHSFHNFLSDTSDRYSSESYRLLLYNDLTRFISDIPSIKDVHLIGVNGKVVVSTDLSLIKKDYSKKQSFKHALKLEDCLHSMYLNKGKKLIWNVSGPIIYSGKLVGVIVIETFTNDLNSVTGDYTGLGNSGETTLAELLDEDECLYLTVPRFAHSYFHKEKEVAKNKHVMFAALKRKEASFKEIIDYRGKEVIATTRYIPKTGWGLVTKMDMEEALHAVDDLKAMSIYIACFSVVFLLLISFPIAAYVVKPINSISDTANKISEGDLGQRVSINQDNELGDLANCFNQMTENLSKAQKRLEDKIHELDRSNTALEKFAYVVSHDLKAPLNTISSIAELLKVSYNKNIPSEGQKMIDILELKAKQMSELIQGILEYSRVNGNSECIKEVVDLNEVLLNIKNGFLPEQNVVLEIENTLPTIKIEKVLVVQVFQNLISNGIKYNDKLTKFIKIGCKEDGGNFLFYVSDNGIGVDKQHYEKIFEIFQTLNGKSFDSTGIGLAIVKKIIENAGGTIWIQSEVRKGSTFHFTLPKEAWYS